MNRTSMRRLERALKSGKRDYIYDWAKSVEDTLVQNLRVEYEANYQEEITDAIENFLSAIVYTLYFSEELINDKLDIPEFMDDLYTTIDMFRTGEYKPEDYKKALEEAGVKYPNYDFTRVYKKHLGIMDNDLVNFLKTQNHRPIITICADHNTDKNDILPLYEDLSLQGNIVQLDACFDVKSNNLIGKEHLETLEQVHFDKILISDTIYVVKDSNGNLSDYLKKQIEFATKHNIKIKYSDEL